MTFACVSLLLSGAAFAQAAGNQVVDTTGATVGTVVSVSGDQVVVKTDKHQVQLPKTSFTASDGKLLFGMTQAQLNAEIEKSQAEAQAKIVPGASVKGSDGKVVGSIDSIDEQFATIKLTSGKSVRVPRSALAANGEGASIGLSSEAIEAQASAAAPSSTDPKTANK
jgi:hypothetical protein